MYKEIHNPYDNNRPTFINLDLVAMITPDRNNENISKVILTIHKPGESISVSKEEADEIKKLLDKNPKDSLSREIGSLTAAVRDLWNLLRARLR